MPAALLSITTILAILSVLLVGSAHAVDAFRRTRRRSHEAVARRMRELNELPESSGLRELMFFVDATEPQPVRNKAFERIGRIAISEDDLGPLLTGPHAALALYAIHRRLKEFAPKWHAVYWSSARLAARQYAVRSRLWGLSLEEIGILYAPTMALLELPGDGRMRYREDLRLIRDVIHRAEQRGRFFGGAAKLDEQLQMGL